MTVTCQECEFRQRGSRGICPQCGGVALYDSPWTTANSGRIPPTPLQKSTTPGLEGILFKVEGSNVSGSFKDRVMDVLVAQATDVGAKGAVVASSGNAAVAAATACARARLPLLVLVPEVVSPNAVRMVELRGAAVVRAGDGPAAVHGLAERLSDEFGLANLASTFSAAGCEWACRGIGHEIAQQRPNSRIAGIAASISVGPVLVGAGNGIQETGRALPSLIAAQAAGCSPIAEAYSHGADEVIPWSGPATTSALAIADRLTGYARQATYSLRRIRASAGFVEAVSDDEMRDMREAIARHDGLDVELASCAAPAALRRRGRPGSDIVCILTGAGLKETLAGGPAINSGSSVEQFAQRAGTGHSLVKEVHTWVRTFR
ncbi:pyridoxal-phosphate dependent enzyme [Amycolatopsis palatopharyngis]|uniref:pyridoxal-phosphate dependent enzyme n=1 Tax=Amycolatopsis palatopharyngis TaxID=187982 RepID=UPI001FE8DD27|nr:pyridoxal-phosphate dependent enzyme [Amycolatopsis palatopharyngis]